MLPHVFVGKLVHGYPLAIFNIYFPGTVRVAPLVAGADRPVRLIEQFCEIFGVDAPDDSIEVPCNFFFAISVGSRCITRSTKGGRA